LRLSDARAALDDARANLPKLVLASRESEARMNGSQRTAEQAERDHTRNVSISSSGSNTPGLISNKDLEASQLALDRAKNDYETTKLTYERAKVEQLNGDGAVKRAELSVQRAELELFVHDADRADRGCDRRAIDPRGRHVRMSTPAFVLTDPNKLRAIFHRPQRELALFRRRDARLAATAAPMAGGRARDPSRTPKPCRAASSGPHRAHRADDRRARRATSASPRRPRNPRRSQVRVLLPGMLVRIEIITERHPDALVVPKRAIRREGDRSQIYVVARRTRQGGGGDRRLRRRLGGRGDAQRRSASSPPTSGGRGRQPRARGRRRRHGDARSRAATTPRAKQRPPTIPPRPRTSEHRRAPGRRTWIRPEVTSAARDAEHGKARGFYAFVTDRPVAVLMLMIATAVFGPGVARKVAGRSAARDQLSDADGAHELSRARARGRRGPHLGASAGSAVDTAEPGSLDLDLARRDERRRARVRLGHAR
jgi:hypothetical protein